MYRILFYLILQFLLINIICVGQVKMNFKNVDNKQGLSQNGVLVIFQDREGYMWLGTHYGLNRYDGFKFKTYYKGDSYNDLCGNTIQSIIQDSVGNIWIATIEGISVFNPKNETLYNLNKFSSKESVFKHTINSMKLIDNNILLTSKEGIWKFNPGKHLFSNDIAKEISNKINSCKLISNKVLDKVKIYQKNKNKSFIISANNHVIISKINEKNLSIIDEIILDKEIIQEPTFIYEDSYSNIWVATDKDRLYQIKDIQGKYIPILIYSQNINPSFSRIIDMSQDEKNNLWIISRRSGVFLILNDNLEKKKFYLQRLNETEVLSNKLRSVYKSRDNTLWLGSIGNGVFFNNTAGIKFENYKISNDLIKTAGLFSTKSSRSIAKDTYNRLWVGTLLDGLHIYDLENKKEIKELLKNLSIFSLTEIDKNNYLAGTSDGLFTITYNNKNIESKKLGTNDLFNDVVFSICHKKNKYWVGSGEKLISFILKDNNELSQINTFKDSLFLKNKSQNTIRSLKYDEKLNCIWIGTETGGLIKADLDTNDQIKTFVSINQKYNDDNFSKYISDIYLDSANNYWLGTRNGLVHFKTTSTGNISNLQVFTVKNGLPSNMIQSIQNDKNNNLWLGTNKGLVKFNKQNNKIVSYDIADGILNYEFVEHASFQDNKGLMYFGCINGVSEFSPNLINLNKYVEAAIIQNIFINGVNSKSKESLLASNLLTLPHSENNLRFEFITFNYINPLKCKYAYKLEGFDKDWIYTSSENRIAEYSNLPTGKYIFKIRASNEDDIWQTNNTTINIEIYPSFWSSFPAFIIYSIVLLSLIYLVSTITKKRVQKKHKAILEKQYQDQIDKIKEAKIQFFINISHEIRTPLTIIVCSIERLIRNLTLNTEQEKDAITVERNVNQMLSLTNELLEIQKMEIGNYQINVRNNDIVEFIKNLVFAIEPLANRQKIKLTFSSFKPSYFIWHDSNALEKAVINLISNAIKYTKTGGKVDVSINPSINNEYLEISVIDNGIGIKKENLSKIFDRFYHLSVNTDSYENGFGIGLSLTKNLIELHKGLISVKSEPEKGSNFTISLPMNENAYSSEEKADKVIWKSDNLTTLRSINKGDIPIQEIDLLNKKIDELDPEKTTILYVDDNIELLKNISHYLLETYNVIVAPNGKIGIEMANQYQPDVIISDIIMPEVDGFELCRDLKNNLNTSHIPIILLTARGDAESQFKGLEIGADYYFPKPFNINLLGLTIKNLIDSREKLRQLFKNNTYKNPQEITTNTRDAEFLEKLLKYVDEHIGEPELNINYLAQTLAMSRSTFFRKIKAITGTTGKEFVDSIRLKKAAELLIHSEMNISEVAYTIGHSNPQYFSKWFKAYYKVSPSEYILNHKSAK